MNPSKLGKMAREDCDLKSQSVISSAEHGVRATAKATCILERLGVKGA
jgi:hypothetical protein